MNSLLNNLGVKILAGEHIQIHGVVLVYKVRTDVARLNKLDERVPRLATGAKLDNLRLAVRNHVNPLDESASKLTNDNRAANHLGRALCGVKNQVLAPSSQCHMIYTLISRVNNEERGTELDSLGQGSDL